MSAVHFPSRYLEDTRVDKKKTGWHVSRGMSMPPDHTFVLHQGPHIPADGEQQVLKAVSRVFFGESAATHIARDVEPVCCLSNHLHFRQRQKEQHCSNFLASPCYQCAHYHLLISCKPIRTELCQLTGLMCAPYTAPYASWAVDELVINAT